MNECLESCAIELLALLRDAGPYKPSLKADLYNAVWKVLEDVRSIAADNGQLLALSERNRVGYDYKSTIDAGLHDITYFTSNERNTDKEADAIKALRDIDGFIGILGGATQPRKFIGWLAKNNLLKSAILCDVSQGQLLLGVIFMKMHRMLLEEEDANGINKALAEMHRNEHPENTYLQRIRRIEVAKTPVIQMVRSDIRHALEVAEPMRYLIYVSNILDFGSRGKGHIWVNEEHTKKFLRDKILDNEAVKEGSYVLCSLFPGYVLLKKEQGSLKLHFADRSGESYIKEGDIEAINKALASL